ncbi:MAG: hypothetical protein HYY45_19940 [Deltaproteobacteria bacterium]|nr:hypothetical protein [Deltaproteobacteria bacterium]
MSETATQVKLQDGTLIRHKVAGYEGRIDGTTEIKTCFTAGGVLLDKSNSKQPFQYRVVIKGELMRQIAPAEDLEILEGVAGVICPHCHFSFQTKPGFADKPGGRCECGGWICPSCLDCRDASGQPRCLKHRKRIARKLALQKKGKVG